MNRENITLGAYADDSLPTVELVRCFLQDVHQATQAEIVGATGRAWAPVHDALRGLIGLGIVGFDDSGRPREYIWRGRP